MRKPRYPTPIKRFERSHSKCSYDKNKPSLETIVGTLLEKNGGGKTSFDDGPGSLNHLLTMAFFPNGLLEVIQKEGKAATREIPAALLEKNAQHLVCTM